MTAAALIAGARTLISSLRAQHLYQAIGERSELPDDAADTIAALLDDRDALTQRIKALEAALRFYTVSDNWLIGGPLDGNSPNYTGGPARAALLVEVAQ